MNHTHLFAAVVSVLVQIPVFLSLSHTVSLFHTYISAHSLEITEEVNKPETSALCLFFLLFFSFNLMAVSVTGEITQKECHAAFTVTHKKVCLCLGHCISAPTADKSGYFAPSLRHVLLFWIFFKNYYYYEYNRIFVWPPSRFMGPRTRFHRMREPHRWRVRPGRMPVH